MKKSLPFFILWVGLIAIVLIGCQREDISEESNIVTAQSWYVSSGSKIQVASQPHTKSTIPPISIEPIWEQATTYDREGLTIVEIPLKSQGKFGMSAQRLSPTMASDSLDGLLNSTSRLVLEVFQNEVIGSHVMTLIADSSYMRQHGYSLEGNTYLKKEKRFTGLVILKTLAGKFESGEQYTNGMVTGACVPDTAKARKGKLKIAATVDCRLYTTTLWQRDCVDWYSNGQFTHTSCGSWYVVEEESYLNCPSNKNEPSVGVGGGVGGGTGKPSNPPVHDPDAGNEYLSDYELDLLTPHEKANKQLAWMETHGGKDAVTAILQLANQPGLTLSDKMKLYSAIDAAYKNLKGQYMMAIFRPVAETLKPVLELVLLNNVSNVLIKGILEGVKTIEGALNKLVFECSGKGITVLGHYPEYIKLADEVRAKRFSIPTDIWNNMSEEARWAANKAFLDELILRKDKILLATPLTQVRSGSYFEKELKYLFSKDYKLSDDGIWLIK